MRDDAPENMADHSDLDQRLTSIGGRFQSALQSGGSPSIQRYLARVIKAEQEDLFRRLLAIQIVHLDQAENDQAQARYEQLYPRFRREIRDVFRTTPREDPSADTHKALHCPVGHVISAEQNGEAPSACPICGADLFDEYQEEESLAVDVGGGANEVISNATEAPDDAEESVSLEPAEAIELEADDLPAASEPDEEQQDRAEESGDSLHDEAGDQANQQDEYQSTDADERDVADDTGEADYRPEEVLEEAPVVEVEAVEFDSVAQDVVEVEVPPSSDDATVDEAPPPAEPVEAEPDEPEDRESAEGQWPRAEAEGDSEAKMTAESSEPDELVDESMEADAGDVIEQDVVAQDLVEQDVDSEADFNEDTLDDSEFVEGEDSWARPPARRGAALAKLAAMLFSPVAALVRVLSGYGLVVAFVCVGGAAIGFAGWGLYRQFATHGSAAPGPANVAQQPSNANSPATTPETLPPVSAPVAPVPQETGPPESEPPFVAAPAFTGREPPVEVSPLADSDDLPYGDALVARGAMVSYNPAGRVSKVLLSGEKVDDAVLGALARFSQLRELYVARCGLDDSHLPAIARLAPLVRLDLSDNTITDEGLGQLAGLPNLERISLGGTQVTQAGVDLLLQNHPNLEIDR